MMNEKRSHDIGRAKYLLFVPFAAAFIMASNIDAVAEVSTQPFKPALDSLVVGGDASTNQVKKEPVVQSKKESAQKEKTEQGKNKKLMKLNGEPVYEIVDVLPEFPGGMNAMMTYLSQTIKYPPKAAEKAEQGTVLVSFVIDKKGKVQVPEVRMSASPSLDAEALRVVSSMPAWTPAKNKGKIVQAKLNIPVKFRLK